MDSLGIRHWKTAEAQLGWATPQTAAKVVFGRNRIKKIPQFPLIFRKNLLVKIEEITKMFAKMQNKILAYICLKVLFIWEVCIQQLLDRPSPNQTFPRAEVVIAIMKCSVILCKSARETFEALNVKVLAF